MSQAGGTSGSGGSGGSVNFLAGNSGGSVPPSLGVINVVGSGGVTVTGNPGTSTLTITVSGSGVSWNNVAGASQVMTSNNGYVANNPALVTLTLPPTSAFGDYLAIIGYGAGGWTIAQGAGQQVRIGANATTVGVTGSLSSANQYDSLELVCVVANTIWVALGGPETAGFVAT